MAKILAIETATEVCSVAVGKDGVCLSSRQEPEGRSHAAKLTNLIQEVLDEQELDIQDVDAVAVSQGPGSYTGLRIGVSTAKGLCYALNKPLIAVSTLQAMVEGFRQKDIYKEELGADTWLCPMIDARRMEVYSAVFDMACGQVRETIAEVIDENSYRDALSVHKIVFIGTGVEKCYDHLKHPNAVFATDIYPLADYLLSFATEAYHQKEFQDVAYFTPFYLKDFIATKPKKLI